MAVIAPITRSRRGRTDGEAGARERLLDAASRLFYEEGIQAVGIQRIIEEANTAKASLYAALQVERRPGRRLSAARVRSRASRRRGAAAGADRATEAPAAVRGAGGGDGAAGLLRLHLLQRGGGDRRAGSSRDGDRPCLPRLVERAHDRSRPRGRRRVTRESRRGGLVVVRRRAGCRAASARARRPSRTHAGRSSDCWIKASDANEASGAKTCP